MHTHCGMRVPPFGHLRVYGYVLLTAAFRSLSRPSSAPSAKASASCSSSLGQHLPCMRYAWSFFEFENSQLILIDRFAYLSLGEIVDITLS